MSWSVKPKVIFITGPTASGKSDLAIYLAKKLNGEIINADSRQVYKYLDIGSGKWDVGKKIKIQRSKGESKINGVTFHLLSIAHPKRNYSLGRWLNDAHKAVRKIIKKGKVPIFCGGTILYLRAIKEGWVLPKVKPDYKLRKELEKKTNEELYKEIKKIDPRRAKELDPNNKRRLIRALEIIYALGKVPKIKKEPKYEVLIIAPKFWDDTQINADEDTQIDADKLNGIYANRRGSINTQIDADKDISENQRNNNPRESAYENSIRDNQRDEYPRESALDPRLSAKIKKRLLKRVPGIIKEIKKLRKIGLSWRRIISFGLEYKWFGLYAEQVDSTQTNADYADFTQTRQNKIDAGSALNSAKSALNSAKSACYKDILRFAKRQIRELRKFEVHYVSSKKEAYNLCKKFLCYN